MDKYLPGGYKIRMENRGEYTISEVIGKGASSVAYKACFENENGLDCNCILKEYYPCYIDFTRDENGALYFDEKYREKFEKGKADFISACILQSKLRKKDALTNHIPPINDNIAANNTVYADVTVFSGKTYDCNEKISLSDKMHVCLAVARLTKHYHEEGFLCLDIKPDNIFVLSDTKEMVEFIDFDSVRAKGDITFGNSVSCTKLWAAPEQENPYSFAAICEATDIYTIGELIFCSVFGRHSKREEHRLYSEYPFDDENNVYKSELSRPKVRRLLGELFQNTLRSSVKNRCSDVSELISVLERIIEELQKKERIISTEIRPKDFFVGREAEMTELEAAVESSDTVFLCGMGGLGKSTLIKNFLIKNARDYDTIMYLTYVDSIKHTVNDDLQLKIEAFEKIKTETEDEYYVRKCLKIRELTAGVRAILVIDNFDGELTNDFSPLFNCSCKLIFVTRRIGSAFSKRTVNLDAITDIKSLFALFEHFSGKKVAEEEHVCIEKLIEQTAGHTLILELLAKQTANSHITFSQAVSLTCENGFLEMAPEQVSYEKDYIYYQGTVRNIIAAIFEAGKLSDEKKKIQKMLSLFSSGGIDIGDFKWLLSLGSNDDINDLVNDGWITLDGERLSMHPVIRETVSLWNWNDEYQDCTASIMTKLHKLIRTECEKEEYPRRLFELNRFIRERSAKNPDFGADIKKELQKEGAIGDIAAQRLLYDNEYVVTDYKKAKHLLMLAESLLSGCKKIVPVKQSGIYKDFLCEVIFKLGRDREDFILTHCEELFCDPEASNSIAMMKLYSKVMDIYTEQGDFENAQKLITQAKGFLRKHSCNHAYGLFYDMLATFYDARLSGAYDGEDENGDRSLLLDSLNKAIYFMFRSPRPDDSGQLRAKYMLSKANVIIRAMPQNDERIRKKVLSLLINAEKLARKHYLPYARFWRDLNIVYGWYYTFADYNTELREQSLAKARELADKRQLDPLDTVDEIFIPVANMYADTDDFERSAALLYDGLNRLCGADGNNVPFKRKKRTLYECLLCVYEESGNEEMLEKTEALLNDESLRLEEIT